MNPVSALNEVTFCRKNHKWIKPVAGRKNKAFFEGGDIKINSAVPWWCATHRLGTTASGHLMTWLRFETGRSLIHF
jgi:hypothetical protein